MKNQREKYYEMHKKHELLFDNHFGSEAAIYWDMYSKHYIDGYSLETLQEVYHYTTRTITNIFNRIDKFLDDPVFEPKPDDVNNANIFCHKALFSPLTTKLSPISRKILLVIIAMEQDYEYGKVSRDILLTISPNLKNKAALMKKIEELRGYELYDEYNNSFVKLFENIENEKSSIVYQISDEARKFISPIEFLVDCIGRNRKL